MTADTGASMSEAGFDETLRAAINDPTELERLYRQNPVRFSHALPDLLQIRPDSLLLQAWSVRLAYDESAHPAESKPRLLEAAVIIGLALVAGTYARLPAFFSGIDEDPFTLRNLGLFFFPFAAAYFAFKQRIPGRIAAWLGVLFMGALAYINMLPHPERSDTILLAAIHLPIVLWLLAGLAYGGGFALNVRTEYIRRNGEAVTYAALILIGGAALTGITILLFQVIGLGIEEWYMTYIAVYGAVAAPLVATAITYNQPRTRIAPLLARVFAPLVLITLLVYLGTMGALRKSPYTDREFLLAFNLMLFGVLALVTLSIAERTGTRTKSLTDYVNVGMVAVGLVLDLVALSAILFRLASYGFTPNRIAVLGANLLIFIHLTGILIQYVLMLRGRTALHSVDTYTARYIVVYGIWAAFITFLFPLLYHFA